MGIVRQDADIIDGGIVMCMRVRMWTDGQVELYESDTFDRDFSLVFRGIVGTADSVDFSQLAGVEG